MMTYEDLLKITAERKEKAIRDLNRSLKGKAGFLVKEEQVMRDYRWNMTEEDFLRVKEAQKTREIDNGNDWGGAVAIGDVLFEFVIEPAIDECYYVNCYMIENEDTGYGYLKDGTPYDLEDDYCIVPVYLDEYTFDEFRAKVIQEIENLAKKDYKFKDRINSGSIVNWWE